MGHRVHYLIAQIEITDRDTYAKYEAGFMEIFQRYKGKILSVDENIGVLEGDWPFTRTVLFEFPSREDALNWYNSEEYQLLAKHRFSASESNIIIVSGVD